MSSREGFGPRLRAQRERKGLTLDAIARSTKIKASLLEALEHNDVSHWPSGIFRRAFLRSYAEALDLAPEPLLVDFERHFPEAGSPVPVKREHTATTPRLTFADQQRAGWLEWRDGWLAAAEAGAVLLAAGVVSRFADTSFGATLGMFALVYYPVTLALTGRTIRWGGLRLPVSTAWGRYRRRPRSMSAADGESAIPLPLGADPHESPGDRFRHPGEAVH